MKICFFVLCLISAIALKVDAQKNSNSFALFSLDGTVLLEKKSDTTANVTFNFRGDSQSRLDQRLDIGETVTSAILLKQGATHYRANVYIDGTLQTPWWLGNSAPSFDLTQQESIDVFSFNILKTAANVYTVLASNSSFQLARNQNP
jgi:hypothetical protein